jgi:TPR repeat protein
MIAIGTGSRHRFSTFGAFGLITFSVAAVMSCTTSNQYGHQYPMVEADLRRLAASCERHSSKDCVALLTTLEAGRAESHQAQLVAEQLQHLCDEWPASGCGVLATLYDGRHGLAPRPSQMLSLLERGCGAADLVCCRRAARCFLGDAPTDDEIARAEPFLRKVCDGGEYAGCSELGALLADSHDTTRNRAEAERLLRWACDHGEPNGCYGLALVRRRDAGESGDEDTRLLKRACDGGRAAACVDLGNHYRHHPDGSSTASVLLELYRRGCSLGDMQGCNNLAVQLERRQTAKPNWEEVQSLYQRACDASDMTACSNLAVVILRQTSGRDMPRATTLLERACAARVWAACSTLAGLIAQREPDRAMRLLEDSCRGAFGPACELLKRPH